MGCFDKCIGWFQPDSFIIDTKKCFLTLYSMTVFTKVLKTLQDIWSGKLRVFTRPGTSLPDRKKIYNNNAESEF